MVHEKEEEEEEEKDISRELTSTALNPEIIDNDNLFPNFITFPGFN